MSIMIIGTGFSGLTLAYCLNKEKPKQKITLIEQEKNTQLAQTESHMGSLLEAGPYDFHISSPILPSILKDLNIPFSKAEQDIQKRFVIKESQLFKPPTSFEKMSKTQLLFFTEKMKISKAFKCQYSLWPSISIHEAFKNIFGQRAADYIASPLIRYLFHSEAEDIELASAFPDFYANLKKGSAILEAYQAAFKSKQDFWAQELKNSHYLSSSLAEGVFTIDEGMSLFINQLKVYLKDRGIQFESSSIRKLSLRENQYIIQSKKTKFTHYDSVIFTISVPEIAKVFKSFDKDLSQLLTEMKESHVSNVYQAWSAKTLYTAGHGIFCPRVEKMPFLFTLFLSNLYPKKKPQDIFLTRTYLSGDHNLFSDSDLAKISSDALARLFKTKNHQALWSKVYRSGGFPKYSPGHSEWKKKIFTLLRKYPRLYLHGRAFDGLQIEQLTEASYQRSKRMNA